MSELQRIQQINNSISKVTEWLLELLGDRNEVLVSPRQALQLAEALDTISATELQQLIEQQGIGLDTASLAELIRTIKTDLPDSSGFSHNLASNYQTGTSVTLNLAGVTTPGGKAVIYQLSDLSNVTASASQTSATVTLTFGTNTGTASLTVTPVCGEIRGEPITLNTNLFTATIQPPTINSPAQGATNVALKPLITWTNYNTTPANHDSYTAAEVRIKNENGDIVWQSGELGAVNNTLVTENLPGETALTIEVRQKGGQLGWSEWSAVRRVTTEVEMGPGKVLDDGGIIACQFDGYWLVAAPASARAKKEWGLYGTNTVLSDIHGSPTDPRDGVENTAILKEFAGAEAAQFCISQGNDWFLPNILELIAVVNNAAVIDSADTSSGVALADMKSVWSSTEQSEIGSWGVLIANVDAGGLLKNSLRYVIPIRRIPVASL